MGGRLVHVVSADGALRRALVARLERAHEITEQAVGTTGFEGIRPGDVVVTTPADCPPERAHELVRAGAAVIILAPVPRPEEHARYERAGVAAYIPMLIDGVDLVRAIARSLERSARPARCHSA